jgi:hypothetical protein
MKRAFTSWGFWVGTGGMLIALVIGGFDSFMRLGEAQAQIMQGFHEQALLGAMNSDTVLMVVPILCALPFTAAFVDDYRSGYIKYFLQRGSRKGYIAGKALSTGISGGMVLFCGIAAAYILYALVLTPAESLPLPDAAAAAVPAGMPLGADGRVADDMQIAAGAGIFGDILGRAVVFLLCGAFWAMTGQLFASFTLSRYVAYASPFIVYYVLVILSERYMTDIYVLNPKKWLDPASIWPGDGWSGILFLMELILVAALLFAVSAGRRLRDG